MNSDTMYSSVPRLNSLWIQEQLKCVAAEWNVLLIFTIRVQVRHVFADPSDREWRKRGGRQAPLYFDKIHSCSGEVRLLYFC